MLGVLYVGLGRRGDAYLSMLSGEWWLRHEYGDVRKEEERKGVKKLVTTGEEEEMAPDALVYGDGKPNKSLNTVSPCH